MGGIEEAENGASNLKSVVRGNAQLASPPSVESQLLECEFDSVNVGTNIGQ
jgi:hypothetical protein